MYAGITLPLAGADIADDDPPLVKLVKKLYTGTGGDTSGATPEEAAVGGSLELFTMAHENALLREPWANSQGAQTRACLLGDSCVGRSPELPGHRGTPGGGVILAEYMTPAELEAFEARGALPADRRVCLLCARLHVHTGYLHSRKQRTFPPNCRLNAFVNAAGEGEYAEEYLIPAKGDAAWTGVVGTVAGLYLNALRLVQTPERWWRVDQSAMAHLTRTPCNMNFPPLYRGLLPDPQRYLQDFFQHRVRVTDAQVLFGAYEELLDEVKPKLPSAPTEEFLKFPPGAVKSFIHRLLHYRVNRLNLMLRECAPLYGDEWAYYMQLYVDAHIGMTLLFEDGEKVTVWVLKYTAHEAELPDLSTFCVQAAVNSVLPPGLLPAERKAELRKPAPLLVQMLIKALPEYAQTRSLHGFFVRCLRSRELLRPLFAVAQAVLLGNYRLAAGERMPWAARKQLVADFTQQTALSFIEALPENEHVVLYVMRTYIMLILSLTPALERLVVTLSPFDRQRAKVYESMRVLRASGHSGWRAMLSLEVLEALRKTHKRLPKKKKVPRGLADCSNVLLLNSRRSAQRRGLKRASEVAFDADRFNDYVKRRCLQAPPDLVAASAGAAAAMLQVADAKPLKKPFVAFSPDVIGEEALMHLADFSSAVDLCRTTEVLPLPPDFVATQVAALARRFGCAADNWATLARGATALVCACCGLRNFYLLHAERQPQRKRRVNNVRAAGFKKLAHNMLTGELRCVEAASCHNHPLVSVPLAEPDGAGGVRGGVLVLRGASVMISPCCGYLCETGSIRVTPESYDCPCCAAARKEVDHKAPDIRVCAYCSKVSHLKHAADQTALLRDDKGRVQRYGFCKAHLRHWARTPSGYLTMDFVSRNMTNRSGNGLVLDPM